MKAETEHSRLKKESGLGLGGEVHIVRLFGGGLIVRLGGGLNVTFGGRLIFKAIFVGRLTICFAFSASLHFFPSDKC